MVNPLMSSEQWKSCCASCRPSTPKLHCQSKTLLDTATLSVEEVTGRLKTVDERSDATLALEQPLLFGGKLYFTEEQWLTRMKEKGSGETSNRPPQQGGGGSNRQRQRRPRKKNNRQLDGRDDRDRCRNYGKLGHWAKDCRQPRRAQANLAQAEQVDELALLMAQLTSLSSAPISKKPIYLDECNAHALLGAAGESEEVVDDGWYFDTGATNHMTGRANVFANLDTSVQGTVKFGDDSFVEICGVGTVILSGTNDEHHALAGVFFIPKLRNSIISIGQLNETSSHVLIEEGVLRVWDQQHRLLARVEHGANRLYVLKAKVARPICLAVRHGDMAWRWHERFGHLNFEALNRMGHDNMVRGMPRLKHAEQLCEMCVVTKHRRAPFPSQAKYRAEKPLELVHGDICGPITPVTPGGRCYFLLLVDDATRYMCVVLLASKSGASEAIKRIQAAVEKQSGLTLKVIRTDNGGEFTSLDFASYCVDEGIGRHFSAPYTPQ
jgi:transposase InsO family protein